MTKKVGILYYGQMRFTDQYDFALSSIKEYCKRHCDTHSFDVYIHSWLPGTETEEAVSPSATFRLMAESKVDSDEIVQKYSPLTAFIIEPQKHFVATDWLHLITVQRTARSVSIRKTISQLYSINQVCNLVEHPEDYDSFILIRTDLVMDFWDFPLLDTLDSGTLWEVQDWINVFKPKVLMQYKQLMKYVKETPMTDEWVCAESLRVSILKISNITRKSLQPLSSLIRRDYNFAAIVGVVPRDISDSYITRGSNVSHRQLSSGNLVCRFQPKKSYQEFQWIGIYPKVSGVFRISFKVRFIKAGSNIIARFKCHSPDKISENWIDPQKPVGEWYTLTSPLITVANNPFILLFLDDIVDHDEVVVEFSDITLKAQY